MDVEPSDSPTRQLVRIDEAQDLVMTGQTHVWEPLQQPQDFRATPQAAQRQLPDDKGVTLYFSLTQKSRQNRIALSQVVDPH